MFLKDSFFHKRLVYLHVFNHKDSEYIIKLIKIIKVNKIIEM